MNAMASLNVAPPDHRPHLFIVIKPMPVLLES
jgi:hypothetical protein